ncbi:MAG: zinc carboxypeptidase, partial [Planctomycetes bacterium]|nr:zinc carboxypeptidase [Planctomycetota bacterium]
MTVTKMHARVLCAMAGVLLAGQSLVQADEPTRLVEVQVRTDRSQSQMDILQIKKAQAQLLQLGFDVSRCGHHPAEGIFRLELSPDEDLRVLRDNGFDVLDDPATTGLRGQLIETDYFDPSEISTMLDQIALDHPGITQVFTIGTTFEGRTIRAIEISNNPGVAEDKPAIQFNAQHHAREVATSHVVMDLINQLTDQYGIDPTLTALVDNYKTVCVPMVNLDGVQFVFDADNLWRKNRRLNTSCPGCGGTGVDPNRNYPYLWGPGCGSSGSCCSLIYRGPSSASEQEIQAMMGLQDQYRFVIATSYHASGRFIDYPYACSDGSPAGQMPEHGIIHEMMNAMATAISNVDGVTYTAF